MKIVIYKTRTGSSPFRDWRNSLHEKIRAIIQDRIDRVQLGNFGDSKLIKNGGGIWELRIRELSKESSYE